MMYEYSYCTRILKEVNRVNKIPVWVHRHGLGMVLVYSYMGTGMLHFSFVFLCGVVFNNGFFTVIRPAAYLKVTKYVPRLYFKVEYQEGAKDQVYAHQC